MKYSIAFFAVLISLLAQGQGQTKSVLFLGNSYTNVNNLPQMLASAASSTGDVLLYDSNTPGGYTLEGHSTNATSLSKIALGNWDYVVLQEQSQRPSLPINQVETSVYPYAHVLDSIINTENPCAETVFYMTWGRKNGDASNCASWPPVCTYAGMDSLLNLRYRIMAESNDAILSPVGAVWKHIRENFPLIELYSPDESHPSVAGTYAAACSFYTALFRKDPTLITFNATLSDADAATIRAAARLIVYDSLMTWHIGEYDPLANFTYSLSGTNEILFENTSENATNYSWDFGDGDVSTLDDPTHVYESSGSFIVSLIAEECGMSDTTYQTIIITAVGVNELSEKSAFMIYPNPVTKTLTLNTHLTDSSRYVIYTHNGQEIQKGVLGTATHTIDVSALSDGIYFLEVLDRSTSLGKQKFVKSER
jgi:hypothetical protein